MHKSFSDMLTAAARREVGKREISHSLKHRAQLWGVKEESGHRSTPPAPAAGKAAPIYMCKSILQPKPFILEQGRDRASVK